MTTEELPRAETSVASLRRAPMIIVAIDVMTTRHGSPTRFAIRGKEEKLDKNLIV
ncbi:MAG TPA: hypothetical protein VHO95_09615 [Candidatus Dormibacteraeota bacterium]|nr:hypothetical protein [Candidatus Dormibacteraeota bacterium]